MLEIAAVLIAHTKPATLFPGNSISIPLTVTVYVNGTAISILLMRIVSPTVNTGLATVLVVIP